MYIFDDEIDFDDLTEDEINELTERVLDWIEYQVQKLTENIHIDSFVRKRTQH